MTRFIVVFLCMVFVVGCSGPRSERTEEERVVREELETTDQPQKHKDPDGAFGAKDFASEAREQSDRDTKALESAAEDIQAPDDNQ